MINERTTTFKLTSLLLLYPENWVEQLADIEVIVEGLSETKVKESLKPFLAYAESEDRDKLYQDYIYTFDFGRKTNLYLTYSQYGETRDRGIALLQLKQFYDNLGFEVTPHELPDYLPLVLEFASDAEISAVEFLLGKHYASIDEKRNELRSVNSPYAHVIDAVMISLKNLNITPELIEEGLK